MMMRSGAAESLTLRSYTGGVDGREARRGHLSQPGMAAAQSGVQGGGGRSVCGLRRVRVSRVTTKSRSTGAGLHSPAWMASCGCAGRVILSGTHRGGAPSGTHYSLACAEVEWLPSCFRFGVGEVDIISHYRTHAATPGRFS